jgi:hypothetical protein
VARIHDIVFDCAHPASVARFWAAVLDGYDVAPYDAAELERLRDLGIEGPEDDPTVLVEAGPGVRPRFFFQRVPEGKFGELRTAHKQLTWEYAELGRRSQTFGEAKGTPPRSDRGPSFGLATETGTRRRGARQR